MEVLCKLNPKVSQMDAVGVSTAGGLTSADISMACSKCSPLGYLALKRRIIGDMTRCEGYYLLYAKVIKMAQGEDWKIRPKSQRVPKCKLLIDLCLIEYFEVSRCRSCRGTGRRAINDAAVVYRSCQACDGTGNKANNDAHRASVMQVSRSAYSRYWSKRYTKVMNMLEDLLPIEEDKAIRQVKRMLRY